MIGYNQNRLSQNDALSFSVFFFVLFCFFFSRLQRSKLYLSDFLKTNTKIYENLPEYSLGLYKLGEVSLTPTVLVIVMYS